MQVLLIEDDPAVRTAFTKALESAGFGVTAAKSATAAFAVLGTMTPNAVVCDFCLPGVDGTTFYHRVVDSYPEVAKRLVFVTGWMEDSKTRRLLAHTTRPVLRKPVEIVDLVNAVRAIAS